MEKNTSGLYFLFKYRKLFIVTVLLGGLLGGGISLYIPKKYLSTAIIYPPNSHSKDLIANPQFGFEVETEQLMQLLESKSMRDRTVEAFKLYDYYEMDTTKHTWKSKLSLKYIGDVSFFRSKYLSVIINVKTEDPELSAKIANFQVSEVNDYREQIFEENRQAELKNSRSEWENAKKSVDSLKQLIYEVKQGDNQLLYTFIENLNNDNFDASDFVDDSRLEPLVEQYVYQYEQFNLARDAYEERKKQLGKALPSVYTVDTAEPSYEKVSPSLFMNAVIGALVFFMITLTLRLGLDKWKAFRAEINE